MKVLVGAFSRSSLGHVVRACRIARFLADRGHDVLFLCAQESERMARELGLPVAAVPELGPQPPWETIKTADDLRRVTRTRMASPSYLSDCMRSDCAVVDAFGPQVIVTDLRHSLGVIGAQLAIPVLSITNLNLLAFMLPVVFPCIIESLCQIGVAQRDAARVFGDVIAIPGLSRFEPMSNLTAENWAVLRQSTREICYLGPIEPSGGDSEPAELVGKRRPRIYFSLGGSNSTVSDLISVLQKLQHRPEQFVIHAGEYLAPSDVRAALRPNSDALVFNYRSDNYALLRHSDVAVVHGGHGTVYECLLAGVPTIALPRNGEQRANGEILEGLGMGFVASPETDGASYDKALERLLGPRAREHAAAARRQVTPARGLEEAARLVEAMALNAR